MRNLTFDFIECVVVMKTAELGETEVHSVGEESTVTSLLCLSSACISLRFCFNAIL